MKRAALFLFSPFLLSLFACSSTSESSLSDSSLSSSLTKVEQEVENVNLAFSDMENGLSNFFAWKSNGVKMEDAIEDSPSFLLSLKSKNTFDEIGEESKEADTLKNYSLAIYSDDLSFKASSLESFDDFHFGLMAKSLLFELTEKTTDTFLPFRQGFNVYFAKSEDQTGLYFDTSKSAITRALMENLYPDITLYERAFFDLTNVYQKTEGLFPLNVKASNLASFVRKGAQSLYEAKKARFFSYEGEETTHFAGEYDDVSFLKEKARNLLDTYFEEGETKEKLSSTLENLESIDLSFDYLFDLDKPLSLTLNGALAFKESESGEGLSSININLRMSFLNEEEGEFSLPNEVLDPSLWTPLR